MRKRKLLLVIATIAATLLMMGFAMAETDPVVCSMELNPTRLAGPGPVNVAITISNSGDTDLKDPVVLYDPAAQIVADFGTNGAALLKAGESKTWTGTYDVNQRMLDNGSVIYFVKYTIYKDSGEAVEQSQPIRAKIGVQTAEAAIDVKRTITPTVAKEGQTVTVKYEIMNAGTITLKNIVIKENADVHKEKQTIKELKSGQLAEISYPVTMGKKNLTSGATITYKAEGESKTKTYTVEDTKISYGESALTATLTSSAKGVTINGKVTFTLELKNTGNVDYTAIRVTDAALGEVFASQELAAGKSLKLDKEITVPATAQYQFTITATDATGGESATATDAVTVTALNPEDVLTLAITCTPDRTEVYETPGLVRFSIKVENTSKVEAKKVAVSHGTMKLYTFDSIPAGESRTLTRDTALSMAGKFRFAAAGEDPRGDIITAESNEVQIAFSVPTPAPVTPTPPPVPTSEPIFQPVTMPPIRDASIGAVPKLIQNILWPVLILAGVLLIGSSVLLIMATKRRADQKKASEAAFDHLERAKRRDYVSPAEEEEKPIEPTAAEDDALLMGERDEEDQELPHMKYARSAAQTQGETHTEEEDYPNDLYDEALTSDLSSYEENPSDESVLYENPYDGTAYDDAAYDPNAYPAEESDGYTDDYAQSDAGVDLNGYPEDDWAYQDAPDGSANGTDGHLPDDRENGYAYPEPEASKPEDASKAKPRSTGRRTRSSQSAQG
ncbi:MAG: hypothetical protein RR301_02275 [Clostridia bacterium]